MKASHLVAIASLVLASPALATTLIVPGPGTGNAQGPTPFNYYGSSGSRVQQIYDLKLFPRRRAYQRLQFQSLSRCGAERFLW